MALGLEGTGFDRGLKDVDVRELKEDVDIGKDIEDILRARTTEEEVDDINAGEEGMKECLPITDMLETPRDSVITSVAVTVATRVSSREALAMGGVVETILLTRAVLEPSFLKTEVTEPSDVTK